MQLYQFCINKFSILCFCIFSLSVNQVMANRSSMVFINETESIYSHNSMLFRYDLKSGNSVLIDYLNSSERYKKKFADIAISRQDGYTWSVVKNQGDDYFVYFSNSSFGCTNVIKNYNLKDAKVNDPKFCNEIFLSQDAKSIVALREQCQNRSVILLNLSNGRIYELDPAIQADILSNEFRTLDMTNDGKVVVFNVYRGGGLYIWQPEENTVYPVHSDLGGEYFYDFALSPDGSKVLSISDHGAELWDVMSRRFEYIFRWDNNSKNLETFSCPPKVDGWAIDSKIYYRSRPNFSFNPDVKIDDKDKSKPPFMWGDVKKSMFSQDSRFVFMLTELNGYFKGFAPWRLNIFDIQKTTMIQSIDISSLTDIPDFMTLSPDMCQLLIMCRDGQIAHIPVNLQTT
ncbi:MAG: hypothetical protein US49_C0002G0102 [candidate division TM6 bacterium GW2011_GWF2_37_49]|nr:MAG: hypothetical protein US49_C0002G0102 [candidate division TM6 bacterium GW2011_GWF2_37_49]